MAEAKPPEIDDKDVYALTALGRLELGAAETGLERAALTLMVLIDGKASVAQIARSAPGMSPEEVRFTLAELVSSGLIAAGASGDAFGGIDPGDFFSITSPDETAPGLSRGGSTEVAAGVSSLQDTGYFVRIAQRADATPGRVRSARPVAIVVEDDPDLGKLLRTYLKLEGIDTIIAANREQVVAAFRRPTAPDVVLLDVQLPDLDGFDVLARMRQHPLLRTVPVIMVTGEATRAAVVKGMHFGADGYVTKPFQIEAVMKALRTVLGPEQPAK